MKKSTWRFFHTIQGFIETLSIFILGGPCILCKVFHNWSTMGWISNGGFMLTEVFSMNEKYVDALEKAFTLI